MIPIAMDSKLTESLRSEYGVARILDQSQKEFLDRMRDSGKHFEKIVYISM